MYKNYTEDYGAVEPAKYSVVQPDRTFFGSSLIKHPAANSYFTLSKGPLADARDSTPVLKPTAIFCKEICSELQKMEQVNFDKIGSKLAAFLNRPIHGRLGTSLSALDQAVECVEVSLNSQMHNGRIITSSEIFQQAWKPEAASLSLLGHVYKTIVPRAISITDAGSATDIVVLPLSIAGATLDRFPTFRFVIVQARSSIAKIAFTDPDPCHQILYRNL
uniref:Uncharacterized protein n=1 Tax=Romanomermis culicivorax TaxID=13658 RepID=A0A915L702_ROMCU